MIYLKSGIVFPDHTRYYNAFEHMFVFSKGGPKTFNPIKDRRNISAGQKMRGHERIKDGSLQKRACRGNIIKEFGVRWNYWLIYNMPQDKLSTHPATFPEQLAHDHIVSWSNEGDLVYDPFMGSGTTAKMAKFLRRDYIGSEISKEYCDIAWSRVVNVL